MLLNNALLNKVVALFLLLFFIVCVTIPYSSIARTAKDMPPTTADYTTGADVTYKSHPNIGFHMPRTDAERALDMVLRLDSGLQIMDQKVNKEYDTLDLWMTTCLDTYNELSKTEKDFCRKFFTEKIMNIVTNYYIPIKRECVAELKKQHGADYEKMMGVRECGGFGRFMGNGGGDETGYLYHTFEQTEDTAYIYYIWIASISYKWYTEDIKFKLIKQDGRWKLDGLCDPDIEAYNFNYDRLCPIPSNMDSGK